jgi:type I restriction enzyme M protein
MPSTNSANLGFEDKLWTAAADKLRGHMDAAEYKNVVLGLIFLKYISDTFQERYEQLSPWTADPKHGYYLAEEKARYSVLEDRDEYTAENVFWVPTIARWAHLQANARQPLRSARLWTRRWSPSRMSTRHSKASCPRTLHGRRSTSSCWAN